MIFIPFRKCVFIQKRDESDTQTSEDEEQCKEPSTSDHDIPYHTSTTTDTTGTESSQDEAMPDECWASMEESTEDDEDDDDEEIVDDLSGDQSRKNIR